jgi:hypothetical protein
MKAPRLLKPLILGVCFLLFGLVQTLFSASMPAIQAQERLQTQGSPIETLVDENDLRILQSVPVSVSSIDLILERILIQENRCDNDNADCINMGANEVLIGSSSSGGSSDVSQVDAFIQQHHSQENECNVVCTNDGLNSISLGSSSLEATSIVSDIDLVAEQELSQQNQCESVIECFSNPRPSGNGIVIGNSISPGSRSVVSNVDADIKQNGEYSNTCNSDDRPDTGCLIGGGNGVGIGISDSGGTSFVSHIDLNANQEISNISDCSNLPEFGNCFNTSDNVISIGFSLGDSNIYDLKANIDQKANSFIDCSEVETCQIFPPIGSGTNHIAIGTSDLFRSSRLSGIDTNIQQSVEQDMECSTIFLCELDGSSNIISIGAKASTFGFGSAHSAVSDIDVNIQQSLDQNIECRNAGQFGACDPGAVNILGIGGNVAGIALGTVMVNNVDADILQKGEQNTQCGDTKDIAVCSGAATNFIVIGDTSRQDAVAKLSDVNAVIGQSFSQEAKCGGGSSAICSSLGGSGNNILNLGDLAGAKSLLMSGIDINTEQRLQQNNECSTNIECDNSGDNMIVIGGVDQFLRCCIIEVDTAMKVSNVDADIHQDLIQNNHCNDDSSCANFQGVANLVSIGGRFVGFEEQPYAVTMDMSNVDTNIAQKMEQDNTCSNNAICFENTARNTVEIGSFSPSLPSENPSDVLLRVSDVAANVDQETLQVNNIIDCSNFATCGNEGSNQVSIGSGSIFGATIDVSNIDADIKQTLSQGNECINTLESGSCLNNGNNIVAIGDSNVEGTTIAKNIDLDSQQSLLQENQCNNGASCSTIGGNLLSVSSTDQASVNADTKQLVEEENECSDGALCTIDGSNAINIAAAGNDDVQANIEQNLQRENNCADSGVTCNTQASNTVNIGTNPAPSTTTKQSTTASNTVEESNPGEYNVNQNVGQDNECTGEGTSCSTTADNTVNIDSGSSNTGSHDVEQNTQQTNKCAGGANCGNSATGTINIGETSSDSSSPTIADTPNNNQEEPSDVEASISAATTSDIGDDSSSEEPSDNNNNNEETTGSTTTTSDSESEQLSENGDEGKVSDAEANTDETNDERNKSGDEEESLSDANVASDDNNGSNSSDENTSEDNVNSEEDNDNGEDETE